MILRRAGFGVVLCCAALWWGLRTPLPEAPRDIPLPVQSLSEAPVRLVIMGTSLTALYEWPAAVAAGLEACLGHPVEMTLVARPGAQSPWGLAQMPRVAQAAPDIVVLEMAINDADLRDGIWLRDSAASHRAMLGAMQALPAPPQIVMMTMSPAEGPRGWVRFRLGAFYAMAVELAAEAGLGVVDLYPRWLALPRAQRGLEEDGLHPDPKVAEPLIAGALLPYLAASRGVVCGP